MRTAFQILQRNTQMMQSKSESTCTHNNPEPRRGVGPNGDKRVAKTRIRLVRAQRKALNQVGDGDDSSIDSFDEYEDSQETTLMEICDVEESINVTKTDLDIVQQKKKHVSEALGINSSSITVTGSL